MKKLMKGMVMLVACMFASAASAQNWQLAWSDEFNGTIGPDWVFETGNGSGGWGNNELQYYRRENAGIENNALVINAKRRGFRRLPLHLRADEDAGRAHLQIRQDRGADEAAVVHGRVAGILDAGRQSAAGGLARCRRDRRDGARQQRGPHLRHHPLERQQRQYAQYGGNTPITVADWHVYAIEWDANVIRWYVDGNKFHEVNIQNGINGTQEFHNDFFLLLNFAIGGNWPGFTVDESRLPSKMLVDYVRVYRAGAGGTGVATAYQDCNYGGYGVALPEGSYTLAQLQARGVRNDDLSSLRVNAGYQVTLYQDDNFTGPAVTKTATPRAWSGDGFNDRATSLVVSRFNQPWSLTVQAENFSAQNGVQVEACSEGGSDVGWIDTGDWLALQRHRVPLQRQLSGGVPRREPQRRRAVARPQCRRHPLGPSAGTGYRRLAELDDRFAHGHRAAGTYNLGLYAAQGGWNINWIRIARL